MKKPLLILIATALLAGCQTTNPAAEPSAETPEVTLDPREEIEQLRLRNLPEVNARKWPDEDRARLRELANQL